MVKTAAFVLAALVSPRAAGAAEVVNRNAAAGSDATAAFARAINSGKGVEIPARRAPYVISSTVAVPAGVTISGAGRIRCNTGNSPCIRLAGHDTIAGSLAFSGPGNGTYTAGSMAIYGTGDGNRISGVSISHFGETGIQLDHASDAMISNVVVRDVGKYGIRITASHDVLLANFLIDGVAPGHGGNAGAENAYGVRIDRDMTKPLSASPAPSRIVVTDGVIRNVQSWEALDTHGGQKLTFANVAVQNVRVAVNVTEGDGGGDALSANYITIRGINATANPAPASGPAVTITPMGAGDIGVSFVVADNIFDGFGWNGRQPPQCGAICVANAMQLVIAGNQITSAHYRAIELSGKTQGVVIHGNTVFNVHPVNGVAQAIAADSSQDEAVLSNNAYINTLPTPMMLYSLVQPQSGYGITIGAGETSRGAVTTSPSELPRRVAPP